MPSPRMVPGFFASPDPIPGGDRQPRAGEEIPPACEEPAVSVRPDRRHRTVDVSAPEPGVVDPEGFQPAEFMGPPKTARRVFFKTRTQLTSDDRGHGEDSTNTTSAAKPSLASPTAIRERPKGSQWEWSQTTARPSSSPIPATDSPRGAPTKPKTTLLPLRHRNRRNGLHRDRGCQTDRRPTPPWARAERHRRQLVRASERRVSGLPQPRGHHGAEPVERGSLYRYYAASEALAASRVRPNPNPEMPTSPNSAAGTPPSSRGRTRSPRPISEDGSRVFFDTPAALVGQDTNGLDVYECTTAPCP